VLIGDLRSRDCRERMLEAGAVEVTDARERLLAWDQERALPAGVDQAQRAPVHDFSGETRCDLSCRQCFEERGESAEEHGIIDTVDQSMDCGDAQLVIDEFADVRQRQLGGKIVAAGRGPLLIAICPADRVSVVPISDYDSVGAHRLPNRLDAFGRRNPLDGVDDSLLVCTRADLLAGFEQQIGQAAGQR
jgi:hypothetical protein